MRETVVEAATVEEAIAEGLVELGLGKEEAGYEVLAEPGKGFLGLTSKRIARVRVWARADEPEPSVPPLADEEPPAEDEPQALLVETEEAPTAPAEQAVAAEADSEPVSDEELDQIADAAVDTVKEILKGFGIEATIDEYEGDEGEIILDIVGDDLAMLIGRHGRTLDAFQTLVTSVTNRKIERRYPVLVDVEGYRSRRKVKLEETAKSAADRARRTGREVRLRPMSSYERKIVHVALRDDSRVTTASEGDDPFRKVVVSPR
jgi:spoIIIJ-associated protein